MFRGTIYITDNEDMVYQAPLATVKIFDMDEDGILMQNNAFIKATCLLPPIEAKIAEADGNEQMFDIIYSNHLSEPFQLDFISCMITYLYRGGNILIFLPELECSDAKKKFVYHMYGKYGIHPGLLGDKNPIENNCFYDNNFVPLWFDLMYLVGGIGYKEYLSNYPMNVSVKAQVINKLINEIQPYAPTIEEKTDEIYKMFAKYHQEPNLKQVIRSII